MFVEDGINKDDLVLWWYDNEPNNNFPNIGFYYENGIARTSLSENVIARDGLNGFNSEGNEIIIKHTQERARMTTKELMDTVVNKFLCPFCGYTMEHLSNENELYWLQCCNRECLLSTPERPSREEAVAALKSIKVVRDE